MQWNKKRESEVENYASKHKNDILKSFTLGTEGMGQW
jgi:hypothetical protein